MTKTLCKTDDSRKLEEKQENPRFKCKKCGNKAHKEKHLCKPETYK
jgi:hypothetical protein